MRTNLKDYQKQILDELKCVPSVGLFMKTGAGKTLTSIAWFERETTSNLLIVCPQKIITQWIKVLRNELDKYNIIEYNVNWTVDKKIEYTLANLQETRNIIVINFDIIRRCEFLKNLLSNDWSIIVDESHKIKSVGTKKKPVLVTKTMLELGKLTNSKALLTATPTQGENGGYEDLYSQFAFMGYVDYSFDSFKNTYCKVQKMQLPGQPFPITKIVGYKDNIEEFKNILKLSCRYYAPKYGDYEPEIIKIDIDRCKNYANLVSNKVYKDITIDNASAGRVAKKTLISGRIMGTNEYGERFEYDDNSEKIDWLEEFISNTDDRISILYQYNVERDLIVELMKKMKKKYIVIDGSIKDKPAELDKDFDVVIGQYQAFGESLDGLQYKCHIMVFYSMPESSLLYRQSLGRIDRVGQTEVPLYYLLVMDKTIDETIYKNIQNKVEFSEKDLNEISI